jgi:TolB protein
MKTALQAVVVLGSLLIAAIPALAQDSLPAPWKSQGIGAIQTPGKADYQAGVFTLQGTLDLWNKADGCHLMWQPLHGDAELVACVTSMDNPGGVGHAKASLCIRQSLDPGAKCVTMCVTAVDGTQFLYRDQADGETYRIYSDATVQKAAVSKGQFPCWLKLVRRGNQFSGFESVDGKKWQLAAQIELGLPADAIVGLAASSHKTDILTKASFEHAQLSKPSAARSQGANNRVAQLTTMAIDGTEKRVVLQSQGIEAPNWSRDGKWLVFNGRGSLWRFPVKGGKPAEPIPIGDAMSVNNDHVLSPDGKTIYFSAMGHLYAVPIEGGLARRISNDQAPERQFKYYLHGISPDGKTLAYVGAEMANGDSHGLLNLYTIPAAGGPDTRLTHHPQFDDGPEYSSDGKWIYFNSELNAKQPGHAQCYRMKPDGTGIEQLTHDERVNWFPHISPDGNWIVYISFPPGTVHHPANKDIILRRMKPDGSQQADLIRFNGGQGTINVNSWSPDSKRFAFVMYPEAAP